MTEPQPLAFINSITAYQSSANKVEVESDKIRLCYNEGAFGPSPKALDAARQNLALMHHYPDMAYTQLREALATRHNIDPSRIVCGAGSDDLIGLLVNGYAGPGDEIIASHYGFAMYPLAAKSVGAKPVLVPEHDLQVDLEGMLRAVNEKTKMVFLANPNNPTGYCISRTALNAFLRALPRHVLFVYDVAYADYMVDDDYSDGFEWADVDGNVCVLRTFSKIHGLGGMRLGWAYGSRLMADTLNRIRNPFNVSLAAEAAAIASLHDDTFIKECRDHTLLWREKLFMKMQELGLKPYPSKGNFVLARMASADAAQALTQHLKALNILVRPMTGYGLPDCVRISVGRAHEMDALFSGMESFFKKKVA